MSTFGPAYDEELDGKRIATQLERVRDFMLKSHGFYTLDEIAVATGDPVASVSAQLRHLRKVRFGSFTVNKRRIGKTGLWEYQVLHGGE